MLFLENLCSALAVNPTIAIVFFAICLIVYGYFATATVKIVFSVDHIST